MIASGKRDAMQDIMMQPLQALMQANFTTATDMKQLQEKVDQTVIAMKAALYVTCIGKPEFDVNDLHIN